MRKQGQAHAKHHSHQRKRTKVAVMFDCGDRRLKNLTAATSGSCNGIRYFKKQQPNYRCDNKHDSRKQKNHGEVRRPLTFSRARSRQPHRQQKPRTSSGDSGSDNIGKQIEQPSPSHANQFPLHRVEQQHVDARRSKENGIDHKESKRQPTAGLTPGNRPHRRQRQETAPHQQSHHCQPPFLQRRILDQIRHQHWRNALAKSIKHRQTASQPARSANHV